MLPLYIIEELEKERQKEQPRETYIEAPDFDDPSYQRDRPTTEKPDEERRGVVIVDYQV